MHRFARPLLLLVIAAALPVAAQDAGAFSASLTLARGNDSLQALTGGRNGVALDGAWDSASQELPLRVGLAFAQFSGTSHTRALGLDENGDPLPDLTLNGPGLTTLQAYGALRFDLAANLRVYLGLSANRHRLTSDLVGQGGAQDVKGTKLGARTDLEYRLTPHLTAVGTFQWVELGVAPSGNQFYNPSWFQAGVRYSF